MNALSATSWKTAAEIERDIRIMKDLPRWRLIFLVGYHLENFEAEGVVESRERQSTKAGRESIGLSPQIEYLYVDTLDRMRRRRRRRGRRRRSSISFFPEPDIA